MDDCRFFDGHCLRWNPCKTKLSCTRFKMTDEGRAAEAAKKAVRTFPMPKWPEEGRPKHWCRWCGGEIVHGRAFQRSWHDGRHGEPNCKLYWQLHTDPRVQRAHVAERDGERCFGCGGQPGKWLNTDWPTTWNPGPGVLPPNTEIVGPYYRVTWAAALELEHTVPLWSVSHLSDHERRPYFGPGNLKLLGPCCHKPKTAGEAKVRAKTKRQSKMRLDVPRETSHSKATLKSTRKLQGGGKLPGKGKGRGFAKTHRPLKSRNSFRR